MSRPFHFVTWDMIPPAWLYTEEQERIWLEHMAQQYPSEAPQAPQTLVRHVAVELPDCPPAWEYNRAMVEASRTRNDLVPLVITHRSEWEDRKSQMVRVLGLLLARAAPLVSSPPNLVAMAGLRTPPDPTPGS